MVVVAVVVVALAPKAAPGTEVQLANTLSEQIILGQDLYSINCVECHGADGEGGTIQGVEGLEGFLMKAIHSQDEMYTRSDETFYDIVAYGQPNLGMHTLWQGLWRCALSDRNRLRCGLHALYLG